MLVLPWNSGCGKGKPAPVPVKGTVQLNGKPLPKGEIIFSVPGEPVCTFQISDGSFSGDAHPGKNRVEVASYKDGPPLSTDPSGPPTKVNTLPPRYNIKTTLDADVTEGGANDFKFTLTSP